MKWILAVSAVLLLAAVSMLAGTHTIDSFGCRLDISEDWTADTSLGEEIALYNEKFPRAVILLQRYSLEKERQINSEEALRQAIVGLYKELGALTSDSADIQYVLENHRAWFDLEFVEEDPDTAILIRKYIKGMVVREKGDGQTLYLLNIEMPLEDYESDYAAWETLADSWVVTAEIEDYLFPRESNWGLFMLFIVMSLMLFFYARNRRIQKSANPLSRESRNFWRCPNCHLVNHIEHHTCTRCGAENVVQYTP